ncbi:MAG: methionine--tRNA ligase [Chloroflexi bacterium]|nr:methionine--tRNA ligase [Chloroflexota bacterium]
MPEKVLIGVAWPYANGPLHLGHIAGCYLPADIFARYHRMRGNQVLMVSGSDQHGTPITIRAEQEGTTPQEIVRKYHADFLASWQKLGISFDLYTSTGTDNHRDTVHDIFLTLLHKGYIYPHTTDQPFCPRDLRFLPDRYVNGTCPNCHFERARGDQCDRCGKTLNPQDLVDPRCRLCGATPQIRATEHLFFRLSAFQESLLQWVKEQRHWRPNVLNFTLNWLTEGLKDRPITRDIEWGIPVPIDSPDFLQKRIYVWFEAVIGYLSAAREWAHRQGQPDKWMEFWQDPACKAYYFIGKDNIPFHTIIWPAMLLGYGSLNLPYDVPANEFLSLEGNKFSTSENWAVWLPDYLSRYDPDPLRYYLAAIMPETADADFSWQGFFHRNNDELVGTYGNLVHRILTFTHRHFQGRLPQPEALQPQDQELLDKSSASLDGVGRSLASCSFRQALSSAMALAQAANRYVDAQAPWKSLTENRARTATTLWTTLYAISALKTALHPFLPFSSQRLHQMMGLPGDPAGAGWAIQAPTPGAPIPQPTPLFKKLDDSIVEEELARLSSQRSVAKT